MKNENINFIAKTLATTVGGLICFGILCAAFYARDAPPKPVDLNRNAIWACEDMIRKHANDPAAIDFFPDEQVKVSNYKNFYTVTVPLRGKNAYNATILTVQQCTMKLSDDQRDWIFLELVER